MGESATTKHVRGDDSLQDQRKRAIGAETIEPAKTVIAAPAKMPSNAPASNPATTR